MKAKKKSVKDIYKSIRKPMAPPAHVEPDRRDELGRDEARREIEQYARCKDGVEGESNNDT